MIAADTSTLFDMGRDMSAADYITLLGIALPLIAKVAIDIAAYFAARKHTALANIFGMAGRQAATVARTLASLPPGVDPKVAEAALISNARAAILSEMAGSVAASKASDARVTAVVQGELDKLVVAPVAVVAPQPQWGPSNPLASSIPH